MLAHVLRPAGALYGMIARARLAQPGHRSRLPVVCIGNFTAGGTGKTPMAIWVGRELSRLGRKPAFLSRGYRGSIVGPHLVDPVRDRAVATGDEPLLLARVAPTVIARDRVAGARLIETLEADVIVMDDGLQNPSLVKDLSIAVIDAGAGLGNGLVIPAGPLRLPLSAQLPLVHAVVAVDSGEAEGEPTYLSGWHGPIHRLRLTALGDVAWLAGRRVIAFAGIGRPEKFLATLRGLGAEIIAMHDFPDHHAFSDAEAEQLLAEADRHRAALLTTEKDMVRLAASGAQAMLARQAQALAVGLEAGDVARLALVALLAKTVET
jgi:tetraacyldisaccharide 4'-kinase